MGKVQKNELRDQYANALSDRVDPQWATSQKFFLTQSGHFVRQALTDAVK